MCLVLEGVVEAYSKAQRRRRWRSVCRVGAEVDIFDLSNERVTEMVEMEVLKRPPMLGTGVVRIVRRIKGRHKGGRV